MLSKKSYSEKSAWPFLLRAVLLWVCLSTLAWAQCSSLLGKVVFNEMQDPSSGTKYIELRILDPSVITSTSNFTGWRVAAYKDNVSTGISADLKAAFTNASLNNCGQDSAWIRVPDSSLSNYISGSGGVNNLNFVLYEGAGKNIVDLFRFGAPSSFYGAGSNYASCPSIESALPSSKYDSAWISSGYKDWYRSPDGTGNWGNGQTANNVNSVCSSNDGDAIGINKVASVSSVAPNTNFSYTLYAQNGATGSPQTNVIISDNLTAAGLTFVSCTPSAPDTCTYSAATGVLTWTVGTVTNPLALNTTRSAVLTVQAATAGIKTNTISANTAGTPTVSSDVTVVVPIDHIRITHDGMGGVCTGDAVTLQACADATCSSLYSGGVSVTLTPGTGWVSNPVLIGASGWATATYTQDLSGTVRYAVTSHGFLCDNTSTATASNATSECDVDIAKNEFVIESADSLVGTTVVAGRPHAMKVTVYRQEGSQCGIVTNYQNAKTLKAWYSDLVVGGLTPSPLPKLSALSDCSGAVPVAGLPGAEPVSSNLSLTFANGIANPFYLCTGDVGKFALVLKDPSPTVLTASSLALTVRPFALDVSVAGNTGATGATGAVAGVAGSSLATTVRGVLWQSADDLNNDGLPDSGANISDNATTPGYDWATTLFAAAPITPVGGVLGILSGTTSLGAGQFNDDADKGTETVNLAYSEVGSFTLNTAAADFLGTSGVAVDGAGVVVGRLMPHHLTTALTNTCGPFTYSGQPFLVTVEAHREGGGLTRNYSTSGVAKDVSIGSDGASSCDPAIGGFGNTVLPATDFANFDGFADTPPVGNIAAPLPISYAQSLAAPATIAICAKDADGVNSHGQTQGALLVRNGRLKLSNAFGSEKSDLSMPIQAQYWSGSSWLLASDDTCTGALLAAATPAVALSGYVGTLDAGNMGPSHAAAISPAGAGKWNLILGKPSPSATGSVTTGSVNVALNLGGGSADQSCLFKPPSAPPVTTGANLPWFRGQYGSVYPDGSTVCPSTGRDPSARGTFGVYAPETKKSIHVRELY